MSLSPLDMAKRYWVDDVPSAATSGSRLNNLLVSLGKGQPMTATSRGFLVARGLNTLASFLAGEISKEQFNQQAQAERDGRIALAQQAQLELEAKKIAEQNAAETREAAMWARIEERLNGMKDAVGPLYDKKDLLLDFYGRDRLLNWLRRHPSAALWVRSRLGKPLAGWMPYGRWAATPLGQDDEFLVDDHPCVTDANSSSKKPISASEGIQLTRDRLRKLGGTVRITGLSGVGKARFAQALFEAGVGSEALPASDVIYADLGNDLTPVDPTPFDMPFSNFAQSLP